MARGGAARHANTQRYLTRQMPKIEALRAEGWHWLAIADTIHVDVRVLRAYRQRRGLPMGERFKKPPVGKDQSTLPPPQIQKTFQYHLEHPAKVPDPVPQPRWQVRPMEAFQPEELTALQAKLQTWVHHRPKIPSVPFHMVRRA